VSEYDINIIVDANDGINTVWSKVRKAIEAQKNEIKVGEWYYDNVSDATYAIMICEDGVDCIRWPARKLRHHACPQVILTRSKISGIVAFQVHFKGKAVTIPISADAIISNTNFPNCSKYLFNLTPP